MYANRPIFTILTFTLATFSGLFGCSQSPEFAISVNVRQDGTFSAVLPDGTVFPDSVIYGREIPVIAAQMAEDDRTVKVNFSAEPHISSVNLDEVSPDEIIDSEEGNLDIRLPFGFVPTAGPPKWNKPLGGCISQIADFQFAIRLHKDGRQLFDVHFAVYKKNGKRCVGAYESEIKVINWCLCPPFTNDQMRDLIRSTIYQAARAVGLLTSIAILVEGVMAPVAEGVMSYAPAL
jgi:hypothetical protein